VERTKIAPKKRDLARRIPPKGGGVAPSKRRPKNQRLERGGDYYSAKVGGL